MKKWIPIVLLFLLIISGIWFWSLGKVPSAEASVIRVTEVFGNVLLQSNNGSDFLPIQEGDVVTEGDVIKTEGNSGATISYFGVAESEIDEDSEMVIVQAELIDESDSPLINLQLNAGRTWSRVMQILDINGEFSVETSDVVATVRGTSFDVSADSKEGTRLWVTDSVIEISNENETFVPEGHVMRFKNKKAMSTMSPELVEDVESSWAKRNKERDANFHSRPRNQLTRTTNGTSFRPAGFIGKLASVSRALRGRLGKKEGKDSSVDHDVLGSLIFVRSEMQQGRYGAAENELERLRKELIQKKEQNEEMASARKAVLVGTRLFYDVTPLSEGYNLKQQIEELAVSAAKNDGQGRMFRLMGIQSRLGEAKKAMEENRYEEAEKMIELAKKAHQNMAREMDSLQGEAKEVNKLKSYLHAIEVRMNNMEKKMTADPKGEVTNKETEIK